MGAASRAAAGLPPCGGNASVCLAGEALPGADLLALPSFPPTELWGLSYHAFAFASLLTANIAAICAADAIYSGDRDQVLFRCALLSKAALEAPWVVPCGGAVYGEDNLVFVANDWHTSLLPFYLQVRGVAGWLARWVIVLVSSCMLLEAHGGS